MMSIQALQQTAGHDGDSSFIASAAPPLLSLAFGVEGPSRGGRVTPESFIDAAIAAGERNGVAALDPDQRLVYLITEAECLCDMEGIDSFLSRYAPDWLPEAAAAFEAVGAAEIAAELRAAPAYASIGDPRLARLNELVGARAGYDHESLCRVVAERRTKRCT
jgi:hypothetical protein